MSLYVQWWCSAVLVKCNEGVCRMSGDVRIFSLSHHSVPAPPVDIWLYIQEVRDSVCDLDSRLQRTKDNVEEIQNCTRSWATPMFDRKESKKDTLLSLDDRAERLELFYALIRSSGEKIHFLLKVRMLSL